VGAKSARERIWRRFQVVVAMHKSKVRSQESRGERSLLALKTLNSAF